MSRLIAGYKVVAMHSSTPPSSAIVNSTNWNLNISDPNRYVPAGPLTGGTRSSSPIQIELSSLENVYFAYVPIFYTEAFGAATECTVDELQALDNLGGYINNSLSGRIASGAANVPPVTQSPSIFQLFQAQWNPKQVSLLWKTSSEQNVSGFHLSRSRSGKKWKRMTESIIPANGANGSQYLYKLKQKKMKPLLYKLEAVDASGTLLETATTQVFLAN